MHLALIIGFAAKYEFQSIQASAPSEEAINVETFNRPPSEVPLEEPDTSFDPPPTPNFPPPEQPLINQEPDRPLSTPAPTAQPVPTTTPTPEPAPKPTPKGPQKPATTHPTPTPEQSPSAATADLPAQFANLPESEKTAGRFLKEYLKSQDLDLPEDLPFGFENWDQYAKFINNDYEEQAYKLGQLPGNTKGVDMPNEEASADPGGNESASPDSSSTPHSGTRFGEFENRELNKSAERLKEIKNRGLFDFFKPQAKKDDDINADLFKKNNPLKDPDKSLEEARKRLHNLDLDLGIPSPSPVPIPEYNLGDLGIILYLNFDYDQQSFKVQWEKEQRPDSLISAQYYPPSNPAQLKKLDLSWRKAWGENPQALVRAVIQAYEAKQ